jgi:nitroimidazol reductase NimA-like FMN-containing flavoprotein (pyridoxamine 5'-phosphate oxidase superfamily)
MRYDEPMYINVEKGIPSGEESIEAEIRNLCEEQSFAVLATQGEGQPYASLIGFAISPDLKYLVFATPRETRKFSLLEKNRHVSFLLDNRSTQPDSLNLVSALTVTGQVQVPTEKNERDKWSEILIRKHPYLESFVRSDTTAIVVAEVFRYFYVRRFQEVFEWTPK